MLRLQKSHFVVVCFLILFIGKLSECVVFRNETSSILSIVKRNIQSDLPIIREFLVTTRVSNHFAETSVTSYVENPGNYAKQTAFSVVLPDKAFISGFSMEIEGKEYKAFVKEKDLASNIFDKSATAGQSAGHVAVSMKNSNRFTVTVNIAPLSKILFKLQYEELLHRENGQYEIITNIQPGQIVKKLKVRVIIRESQPLLFVNAPYLQSGSSTKNLAQSTADPHSRFFKNKEGTGAVVIFEPDIQRQVEFACSGFGNKEYNGFAGQFIVNYDVQRTNEGGEVLYQDNFFFISFAPQTLDPIPKHMVFILDTSGSMYGFKMEQLKDAMLKILPQLNEEDVVTIIQFESYVYDWDIYKGRKDVFNSMDPEHLPYGSLASQFSSYTPSIIQATKQNVEAMKNAIDGLYASGGTNSIGGLEVGLLAVSKTQQRYPNIYLPIVVFLTDGLPNGGSSDTNYINQVITNVNKAGYNTPIYSLSFGEEPDVDRIFLQKLSGLNNGEEHKISIDLDSSKYIQSFYKSISVPLLSNVAVNNLPPSNQVTQIKFPIFFKGSELMIVGKGSSVSTVPVKISAKGKKGPIDYEAKTGIPLVKLERVWAYLTVKQLADQYRVTGDTTLAKIGIEIAKNHSLVTDFTSLVVVKPDQPGPGNPVKIVDAYTGIFPSTPSELPMCSDIQNYVQQFISTYPNPTTTYSSAEIDDLLAGGKAKITITKPVLTTTITTPATTSSTTMKPVTTSTTTTTTKPVPTSTTTTKPVTTITTTTTTRKPVTTTPTTTSTTTTKPVTTTTTTTTTTTKPVTTSTTTTTTTQPVITSTTTTTTKPVITSTATTTTTKPVITSTTTTTTLKPVTTSTTTTTTTKPVTTTKTTTIPTKTTTPKLTCKISKYGCCHDGVEFAVGPNFDGCDPIPKPENCDLPPDYGKPYNYYGKWHYRTDKHQCIKFKYGGSGGNDNRFANKQICEETCIYPKATDACFLPLDKGHCQKWEVNYFFDVTTGSCQTFWYAGCGGNDNRFKSKDLCENLCIRSKLEDKCLARPEKGKCTKLRQSWFYDPMNADCQPFVYGGCGGNENNFGSKEKCEKACIK
uniref:Inter-alpha-trypsin inhibitor heavy chain H4-like isoform X2 n=1 Tax=Diabrotica virgifera virgifera TaxID=50390 RepID=A0A6P7FEX3_DIAVI